MAWLALFFTINIVQSIRLVVRHTEAPFSEPERKLLAQAFPQISSRGFKSLLAAGERVRVSAGTKIVGVDENMNRVFLLTKGEIKAESKDGRVELLRPGSMLGELTFALDIEGRSAHNVFSTCDSELLCWDYGSLTKVLAKHRIKDSFLDGLLRGVVRKNKLLVERWRLNQ